MYEQCTIIGNIGADPELKYLPSGDSVTNFSVAVNTRWTKGDGTQGSRVTWYRVACWGRLAEICNQYLAKGRKVMVTANRIDAESYLGKDGQPKAALKLTASAVKFLDSPAGDRDDEKADEIPF
jgi:single-strand DNA-binding protein